MTNNWRLAARVAPLAALLSLTLLAGGCGKPKGSVSGTVTYKDKPVPSGTVTFLSEDGQNYRAETNEQGTYKVEGIPAGPMKVSVTSEGGQPPGGPMFGGPPGGKAKMAPPKDVSIPAGYGEGRGKGVNLPEKYRNPETSGLTVTVNPGDQQYDINLK